MKKITIKYKIPEQVDKGLDDKLEQVIKDFGLELVGSGYDFQTKERDLVFESF